MENVRLAIVGSRTFNDYATLVFILNQLKEEYYYTLIVSGGAKGADTMGETYASTNKIPTKIFKADWNKYGKRAGFIRNVDIIDNCDLCVCFWDGESHGTKHDIELCEEKHKLCYIYNFVNNTLEKRDFRVSEDE